MSSSLSFAFCTHCTVYSGGQVAPLSSPVRRWSKEECMSFSAISSNRTGSRRGKERGNRGEGRARVAGVWRRGNGEEYRERAEGGGVGGARWT